MSNTTFNTTPAVLTALKAAQEARRKWEAGTYAASNTALYGILQQSYSVMLSCIANPTLTDGVKVLMKDRKLKFSTNTSLELLIIRIVFADEQTQNTFKYRLLSYARVLACALEDAVAVDDLPAYINKRGGIDEIRRDTEKTDKTVQDKQFVSVAKKVLHKEELGLFDAFKLPNDLKPVNGSRYSVAIVRDNQDGTGTIVHGVKDATVVESALKIAGKLITEDAAKRATDQMMTNANEYELEAKVDATQALATDFAPQAQITATSAE